MDAAASLTAIERWIALRTSARWEKKLFESLKVHSVPCFLPTVTRVVNYLSKRRTAELPLFSGYVFCSEEDFLTNSAVPTPVRQRVAQVLRPPNYDHFRSELMGIAELLVDRELIQEVIHGQPGDRVRVTGGALKGVEGVLASYNPKKRTVMLTISFLGTSREVELDDRLVEKIRF